MNDRDFTINSQVEASVVGQEEAIRRTDGALDAIAKSMEEACAEWGVMGVVCVTVRTGERQQLASMRAMISPQGMLAVADLLSQQLDIIEARTEYGDVDEALRAVELARKAERKEGR